MQTHDTDTTGAVATTIVTGVAAGIARVSPEGLAIASSYIALLTGSMALLWWVIKLVRALRQLYLNWNKPTTEEADNE